MKEKIEQLKKEKQQEYVKCKHLVDDMIKQIEQIKLRMIEIRGEYKMLEELEKSLEGKKGEVKEKEEN